MDSREDHAMEDRQNRTGPQSNHHGSNSGQKKKQDLYLGCLTKQHLIMISVAVGLVVLPIIITVPAVVLTRKSDWKTSHLSSKSLNEPSKSSTDRRDVPGSSTSLPSFPTGGDMLDFLIQSGDISERDGLLATWVHRANTKEEMNEALASDVMILESDVTLQGYGTANVTPIPIMAHPPNIYSDNTLDEWLDAVLASRKAMKLDFKALGAVGLSLDLLSKKNSSRGINRPVWINADILPGPNSGILPVINGTRFLQLVEKKFPDVTLSPGWKVVYIPPPFGQTYTKSMVEKMYDMIKDVPQKVTFPIHALLARRGWQHVSWLLSQSPRYTLTLWQGYPDPTLDDLLFIRDNTHPARVYYDIYEPMLSAFKEAVAQQGRLRRFYPGGDLMDFLYPSHTSDPNLQSTVAQWNSLSVHWFTVTDWTSLLSKLLGGAGGGRGGMLVVRVTSDINQPGVPVVEGSGKSSEALTLEAVLQMLGHRAEAPWGIHLRIQTQQLLEASLKLLDSAYSRGELYRPVWISMEGLQNNDETEAFASAVDTLFPYVTLALTEQSWPPVLPAAVTGLSQRVALHLNTASLPEEQEVLNSLTEMMDRYDLVVEADALPVFRGRLRQLTVRANTHLYMTV